MLRPLFLTVLISAIALPSAAQDSKVRPGEIALGGTVETLDVIKSTLTLRASSFTVAAGTTKALPQPKLKAIQIGGSTQFIESGGLKNTSLGDLGKGLKIRVVGKEMGAGKPFLARVLIWTAPEPALEADPDTPPNIASLLPPPQRAGDISLRVIDAGFKSLNKLFEYQGAEKRPLFYYAVRFSGPQVSGTNDYGGLRTLADLVTLKRLLGPDGQILARPGTGPLEGAAYGGGQRVFVNDLDPAWANLTAEYEVLDPKAPPAARGISISDLTIDHIPVPGAVGKSIPLNQTLTAALGTQITLEKVVGEQVSDRKVTNFYMHWTPPKGASDLRMTLVIAKIESGGTTWESNGGGGGTQGNNLTSRIDTLGPDGAQEMSVTFRVTENAPSLQDRKWYKRVRTVIPVASILAKAPPVISPAAPGDAPLVLAEAKTDSIRVQAELRDKSWGQGWGGWLWIKSQGLAADEKWLVHEVSGTNQDGKKLNTWTFPLGGTNQFWRADGKLVEAGEYSQPIVATGDTKPARVNVTLNLEKARRLEHWSYLKNIPVPLPGQTIELKSGQVEDDYLSVRRVISFESPAALPGLAKQGATSIKQGLAVVVEISPLIPNADVLFQALTATDDGGRDFSENPYPAYGSDLSRVGTENTRFRTVILPFPPAVSKSLEMRFSTVETAWSGQTQPLVLKDIPVQ